jgi:hypothetical protein
MSKASANGTLTALKAALNFAVAIRLVSAAAVQEWRDVKPYKGADKRRDLFLDLTQRRALLAKAAGAVRDLIEGSMLTGARAGELVNATRGQFDVPMSCQRFGCSAAHSNMPSICSLSSFSALVSLFNSYDLVSADHAAPLRHRAVASNH